MRISRRDIFRYGAAALLARYGYAAYDQRVQVRNGGDGATGAVSLLNRPLVQSNSPIFTFVGSFTLPSSIKLNAGCGTSIGLSVDGNSMYFNSYDDYVGKIDIPASGTGASNLLIDWLTTPGSAGPNLPGGALFEYGGSVYKSKYTAYDSSPQTGGWIQKGTTSLTGFSGLYSTSGLNQRTLAQGFYAIPPEWQATLGGPCITFGSRISIISNAQCGYGVGIFAPALVGGANVPVARLLDYDYSHAIEPGDSSFAGWAGYPKNANGGTDLFSSTNAASAGGFIVPGSRTLLIVTAHGYGVADNGCRAGSSVHNDPNRVQCVAYDLRDLVDVKNGIKQPYEPKPYAWWTWNSGGVHWTACVGEYPLYGGWGAYDPVKGRWYMSSKPYDHDMYTWNVNSL